MGLTDSVEVPRREMVLFFVADKSGSMAGTKIQALNQAVKEVIPMLDDISSSNADAKIKIAVLEFSSGCNWMYEQPKEPADFIWQDLKEEGLTDMGDAFKELNSKLSRSAFMQSAAGTFAPVILLLTDGEPTDDWMGGLGKLRENKWFQQAIKIAIAIGNDANKDVLKEFTGNIEAVVEVHNIEALKKIIRLASVTASTIGSQSSTAGNKTKQDLVVEKISDAVADTEGAASAAAPSAGSDDDDWD
ncbi:MAG TPA: VWA domain-containing protein [Tenuifilaceae bacterium]|nr:VWA domain-containing protein [Tenuifilaceae bacterium]